MDKVQCMNFPSSLHEVIQLKDLHTAVDPPIYVEVGSMRTTFPTHPASSQVSTVLKMTNHFKMNMILCGFWEKIDEETPEQLEKYEKDQYYSESDLIEALKELERDTNAANSGPCAVSEICEVGMIFEGTEEVSAPNNSLPNVFHELKWPEKFEFTEEDKEEFRQLFAEEAKILVPQMRKEQLSEITDNQPPKKYNEEGKTTILKDSKKDPTVSETAPNEIILRTPVASLLPAGLRSSAMNMPYSLDSSSIEALGGIRFRTYGIWYYVCLILILLACATGYVLSRVLSASK